MRFRVFILAGLFALASGCGGCGPGGFPTDAAVDAAAPGRLALAWTLRDLNGQAIQCDQVGASFVNLQLRNRATAVGSVASLSCAMTPTVLPDLAPSVYDITFELTGTALTTVTAPEQKGVLVESGRDTALAPIAFVVDARGGLRLSLAAPPATSNCEGGAGITGVTITLVHASGGCAPVTFVRAQGSTVLDSYTVNCSSPRVSPCIETDQTLTVASMASGPYTIHVRGKVGATDCWKNDNALQVPPQGKTLVDTLNLAFQSGTPGC